MSRARSSQKETWERLRSKAFRAPWLSAERERELIAAAQGGSREAMAELCATHLRLVVQIASQAQRAWVQPDDLVGEGCLGLIEAIRRFDLFQSARLSTYAAWWIRARMRNFTSETRSIVGLPSTRGARIVRAQLGNAERTLSQRLKRSPTHAELAAELNVPESDVSGIAVAYAMRNTSLSHPDSDQPIDLPDPGPTPEEALAAREAQRVLEASLARSLAGLAARDRMLIDAHFLREESSLADLGEKLGISRQRVSQIVLRVRKKLERNLSAIAC